MGRKSSRINLTLPPDLFESVEKISLHMGVSKSALIVSMLSEAIPPLYQIVSTIPDPENINEIDKKRFRGKSQEVIKATVDELESHSRDSLLGGVPLMGEDDAATS